MDQTLHALGGLLVTAIPTIVFFVLLCAYLNAVYFKPMAKVLDERRRATEGMRELAQRAFEAADQKGSEFEQALQLARAQMHQENDALRRKWVEQEAAHLAEARGEADRQIQSAKREIAAQVERAQAELDTQVESFSERITNSLLRRRVA